MQTISAARGTERKTFPIQVWNEMPKDKAGWKPVADEPEEIRNLRSQKDILGQSAPPKPDWDETYFQPLGMIPFQSTGNLGSFEAEFMPGLERLGLNSTVARNLASAVWHFANDQWGQGKQWGIDNAPKVLSFDTAAKDAATGKLKTDEQSALSVDPNSPVTGTRQEMEGEPAASTQQAPPPVIPPVPPATTTQQAPADERKRPGPKPKQKTDGETKTGDE